MRKQTHKSLDGFRREHPAWGKTPDGTDHGYFEVDGCRVISSGSAECDTRDPMTFWEHVSVSLPDRCPTWDEMCTVKHLFWAKDETVLQFHPRLSEYKNQHEFCLHLWKKAGTDHELPPNGCV